MRVLIAEDEEPLANAIKKGLGRRAIAADVALDGLSALQALDDIDYDVLILDRDLPELHGDEVCRRAVVSHPETRILMLTAARRSGDTVDGLAIGADDYLTKPFDFDILVARLRALQRRNPVARTPELEIGDVRLDPFRVEVYRAGRFIHLSRKEFAVLEVLMEANGGVVSAEDLLARAWDENADPFTNSIRVTVSKLRKKLGEPWVIDTVPGSGYRMIRSER